MCAISGTLGLADTGVIEAMNLAMAHRGPDDGGVFVDASTAVALGHRRLSIIDVSRAGHQPMASPDGRFHVVFNGEIYNYRELRRDLETRGLRFRTQSDTEVLLAAYAHWGAQCVDRLDGMFAFAIHDRESPSARLFLARDRFGIKPLYYTIQDGVFLFASELKGMLASGRVPRYVDAQAVWHYLSLGSVPGPRSILDGVSTLMPGHWMEVGESLAVRRQRWWDVAERSPWRDPAIRGLDAVAAAGRVRELLEQATRRHLVADVEVGAFLSGGIDSSAVVGLMSLAARRPVKTFSIATDGSRDGNGEMAAAREVASRFGTEHREVSVTGAEVFEGYDDLVHAIDQPSLDGTNTWIVSRAAAEHVKVALSGLGGDELFAGYPHFRDLHRVARWNRWLRPGVARVLSRVLAQAASRGLAPAPELLSDTRARRHVRLRNLAGISGAAALAGPWLAEHPAASDLDAYYRALSHDGLDSIGETSYVELRGYLANTLLRDVDATAMANSLEVRPVLLDHHLAEFVFALPAHLKLATGVNKPALVNAVGDLLPAHLVSRPKVGFELPLAQWLCGPFQERARSAFSGTLARTLFSSDFLQRMEEELVARRCASLRPWAYLCLLEWMLAHRCELAA